MSIAITGGPGRYELGHVGGDNWESNRKVVFQLSRNTCFEGRVVGLRRLDVDGNLFALEVEANLSNLRIDWYSPCERKGVGELVETSSIPQLLGFAVDEEQLVTHVFANHSAMACPQYSQICLWDNRRVRCLYDSNPSIYDSIVEIHPDCPADDELHKNRVGYAVRKLVRLGQSFVVKWHHKIYATRRYVRWEILL